MRMRSMIAVLVILAMMMMLGACAGLQPQPSPADQIQMGHDAVSMIQAAHDLQTAVHAATQPTIAPDGSSIPGIPVPPKIVSGVDKGVAAVDKAGVAVTAGLNAASDPGANAGTFLQTIAPLTGQAAPWVFLAGSILAYMGKKKQLDQSNQALASTASAIQSAASTGAIVVSPAAVPIVNSIVTAHPGTDAIVDALSDASKTPRI